MVPDADASPPSRRQRRPTQREIDAQRMAYQQDRFIRIVDGIVSIVRTLIRCTVWVVGLGVLYLSVQELAGRETTVAAALQAVVDLSIDRWLFVVAGTGGGLYGFHERKLRERKVEELAQYIEKLEDIVDPNRSRSGLNSVGKPTKEDRDNGI